VRLRVLRAFAAALLTGALVAGSQVRSAPIPDRVDGQDINDIYGWWAAIYPNWPFVPDLASVWPAPRLWTPSRQWSDLIPQSPAQVRMSADQLNAYGSSVDVLEFNPNPAYPDFVQWKQGYFSQIASLNRAFIVGYEQINGTRLHPIGTTGADALKYDMSDPYNRAVFTEDIDFIFREIVQPYSAWCVTSDGRAVIYLWNTESMLGDFGSLLNEVKAQYPVMFIGSEWHKPDEADAPLMARLDALDGFMAYSVLDPDNAGNYSHAITEQYWSALVFRNWLRDYEATRQSSPGKYRLFIPTFQSAYDDSRFPGRQMPNGVAKVTPMYPGTQQELLNGAQALKTAIVQDHIFDNYGPFVIYNELYEGAAVIESQPYAAPPSEYHAFGLERLSVVGQFFGAPQGQE